MPIGNSGAIDERENSKIDSELSYSPSLEVALNLILGDPAFVGERETPSFKFIRAARFLKENAPHVSLLNLGIYFLVAHRMFLRFDLSDMVRSTPSANPAAQEMKIKTAWGIGTVGNSRCVSTGSVFWTMLMKSC